MCRHLAYLGPRRELSDLLFNPPHSLLHQTYLPNDMRGGGTVNVDGFGVGWYGETRRPIRYRRSTPMWTDAGFTEIARATASTAVVAAVRSATIGLPINDAACAPFSDDRWLFSLNGRIEGWPHTAAEFAKQLPITDILTLEALTDTALIWAVVKRRLADGEDAGRVLTSVLQELAAANQGSRLNFLLTDGETVYATTWTHSLSLRQGADYVLLSSEPLDEHPDWQPVPDAHLVVATPTAVSMTAI
ncbi:ergothioneine biosynthesis protein EgtC [Pseudonocardiaceae bacterium YIM PH 21723]|nr:ergothioneine biosynthesis protein EgtC [Pseudonocardiaceae bacterium YIM PH 21723]